MSHLTVAIAVANTAIVVLGALIAYLALVAYRRTEARELRALAVGFGIVTLGSLLGGAVDLAGGGVALLAGRALLIGVLVQSAVIAVGFGVITYSLYRD